jgi:serine/threonine protein kinase
MCKSHPRYSCIRTALESFTLHRPEGDHTCLVQTPMWESLKDLLRRNPTHHFNEELLKGTLQYVLSSLDYLHTKCRLVHTGKDYLQSLLKGVALIFSRYKSRQSPPRDCGQVHPQGIYQGRVGGAISSKVHQRLHYVQVSHI